MFDSASYGMAQARRAAADFARHIPNPDSSCVCVKCETARADRAMVSRHNGCEWTHVSDGIFCDTHADWVIFREWEV